MKFVRLPFGARGKAGTFGKYYRLSPKRGVKVLMRGYPTLLKLTQSDEWTEARQEVNLLHAAEDSGLSPRYAKRVVVYRRGKFFSGIWMEHIEGRPLKAKTRQRRKVIRDLKSKLRVVGLENEDLVDRHVLVQSNGQFRIVDFTPEQVQVL